MFSSLNWDQGTFRVKRRRLPDRCFSRRSYESYTVCKWKEQINLLAGKGLALNRVYSFQHLEIIFLNREKMILICIFQEAPQNDSVRLSSASSGHLNQTRTQRFFQEKPKQQPPPFASS
ncbi:hypothetical protein YC2023_106908 [Brassica napus]